MPSKTLMQLADVTNVLMANYNGNSASCISVLEGITGHVSASTVIFYNQGCNLTDTVMQKVYWQINDADAIVAVLGLSPLLEGENGDAYLSEAGGDKKDIKFPYAQLKYLRKLREKTKKPLIVVLMALRVRSSRSCRGGGRGWRVVRG